jgi:hypothetical protein
MLYPNGSTSLAIEVSKEPDDGVMAMRERCWAQLPAGEEMSGVDACDRLAAPTPSRKSRQGGEPDPEPRADSIVRVREGELATRRLSSQPCSSVAPSTARHALPVRERGVRVLHRRVECVIVHGSA